MRQSFDRATLGTGGRRVGAADRCRNRRRHDLALGVEAVKAGRGVYFCTLADLITSLAKAERDGSLREPLSFLCRPQLLIVDEIGYLPVVPGGGNLFFQLVNARHEKGAEYSLRAAPASWPHQGRQHHRPPAAN